MKYKTIFLILPAFAVLLLSGCLGDKNIKYNQPAEPKQVQINMDNSVPENNNIVPNPSSNRYACKTDDDCGICDCDVFQECANISWWQEKLGPDIECECDKEQCICKNERCVKQ